MPMMAALSSRCESRPPDELERVLLGYGPDAVVEVPADLAGRIRPRRRSAWASFLQAGRINPGPRWHPNARGQERPENTATLPTATSHGREVSGQESRGKRSHLTSRLDHAGPAVMSSVDEGGQEAACLHQCVMP